jgi:hypothetical protein
VPVSVSVFVLAAVSADAASTALADVSAFAVDAFVVDADDFTASGAFFAGVRRALAGAAFAASSAAGAVEFSSVIVLFPVKVRTPRVQVGPRIHRSPMVRAARVVGAATSGNSPRQTGE